MTTRDATGWQRVDELPAKYGPLTLHPGGLFGFGQLLFDQSSIFSQKYLGDVTVSKASGVHQPLRLELKDGSAVTFRCDGTQWEALEALPAEKLASCEVGSFALVCKSWTCQGLMPPCNWRHEGEGGNVLPRRIYCPICHRTEWYDACDIHAFPIAKAAP